MCKFWKRSAVHPLDLQARVILQYVVALLRDRGARVSLSDATAEVAGGAHADDDKRADTPRPRYRVVNDDASSLAPTLPPTPSSAHVASSSTTPSAFSDLRADAHVRALQISQLRRATQALLDLKHTLTRQQFHAAVERAVTRRPEYAECIRELHSQKKNNHMR